MADLCPYLFGKKPAALGTASLAEPLLSLRTTTLSLRTGPEGV